MLRVMPVAILVLVLAGCGRTGRETVLSGTLEGTELRLSAALAARVLEVRVAEGATVKAGDTLLTLDLSLQRLQRVQSAAGLATLAARLQRSEDAGRETEAARRLATETLARVTALHDAGSATEQQLDEARAQREQAEARAQGARHEHAALEAERAALEAGLAVQDRLLRDAALLAPAAGTVLQCVAQPGEWTSPGQVALVLADLGRLELRFYLGELDLARIRVGQELAVRADAFPDETFPARVSWVSAEAEFTPKNAQTREARAQLVYAAKAAVDNPQGRLLIGMPAEVLLEPSAK
jgi:HlyD family secretion protein